MSVTHKTAAPGVDDGDPNTISANEWDEDHAVELFMPGAICPVGRGFWVNQITGASSLAMAANRVQLSAFMAGADMTIDDWTFEVTSAAGTNAKLALYSNVANDLYPDALLESSANLGTGTTGEKSEATTINLVGGAIYWIGVITDGAPSLRAGDISGTGARHMRGQLGVADDTAFGTDPDLALYSDEASFALPDPFPVSPTAWISTQLGVRLERSA